VGVKKLLNARDDYNSKVPEPKSSLNFPDPRGYKLAVWFNSHGMGKKI